MRGTDDTMKMKVRQRQANGVKEREGYGENDELMRLMKYNNTNQGKKYLCSV